MKYLSSKHVRHASMVVLALLALARSAGAQQPMQLAIQTYAGLSITGAVGTVYSIEYVTALAQTNDWRSLAFLQQPTTNFLWIDTSTPATGQRFYRAIVFPVPTNFVFIPPGNLQDGQPDERTRPFG
jgi:hypothetical protein